MAYIGDGEMTCPKCGYEWQEDGYFELSPGSEITCGNPECDAVIVITDMELTCSFYGEIKEA